MVSSPRATGSEAPEAPRLGRLSALLFLVLLFGGVLGQSTLALAIPPVEIWYGGVYDDAPHADIPMASSQLAALPCTSAGPCLPARVVGTVIGTREVERPTPLLEVSRSRAPPVA